MFFPRVCFLSLLLVLYNSVRAEVEILAPGLTYEHVISNSPMQSIHIVRGDPVFATLSIESANDKYEGSEKTSEIARRKNAIVAINGSFFDFAGPNKLFAKIQSMLGFDYSTIPVYALKIKGCWFSLSSTATGLVGWRNDQAAIFDSGKISLFLKIGENRCPVNKLNSAVAMEFPTVYTYAYRVTPTNSQNLIEITIADGRVTKIQQDSHGGTIIPANGFVYSFIRDKYNGVELSKIATGDLVSQDVKLNDGPSNLDDMEYVLGSTPLLVKEGGIVPYLSDRKSSFYVGRHPRTAIGIMDDGTWVLVVIDGRQEISVGFTILELANYMKKLGCKEALNLDGGGSTTMVIKGHVVNSPSGHEWGIIKKEQPVSHAILVLPTR